MDMDLRARVRKPLEGIDYEAAGNDAELTVTPQLELLIAQAAAPWREVTRLGRAYVVNTTTAIGAVVAIPTTAVLMAIFNNESDIGRTYSIDWVGAINAASTAVVAQAQLIGMVGQLRETPPVDGGLVIKKMNGMGGGSFDTKARTILSGTALPATTGLATNWLPIGPSVTKPSAVATPGYGLWAPVDGRILVPPGRYFALHVMANVVGETFNGFIGWSEFQTDVL